MFASRQRDPFVLTASVHAPDVLQLVHGYVAHPGLAWRWQPPSNSLAHSSVPR